MTESEVQITEVMALSFLLTQCPDMPSLQAVGLSEEMFSPGGRMLYRCIQEAAQHQPHSPQAILDVAPKNLHPLISELKELGGILYSEVGSTTPESIRAWVKEAQC